MNNKKIYIVLTYTGTMISRLIKYYCHTEYCHVSIALDENLEEMYSFGRINAYNPFIGGFVHEGINVGTFKRFKNTKAEIYEYELSKNEYRKIKRTIKKMKKKKDIYDFNFAGLVAAGFNKKIKRNNSFYCAEFIKFLFEEAGIKVKLPDVVKPIDFVGFDNLELKYSGKLRNYNVSLNK